VEQAAGVHDPTSVKDVDLRPGGDDDHAAPDSSEHASQQHHFRCKNCGAEVGAAVEQRSFVCPFCDSTYVVEFAQNETGRQPPEFVIGFAVTPEQAHERFQQWLKQNAWFRPGDLKAATIAGKLKGVYLPFWGFTMLARSHWRATIGEYWYRTETYTTRDSKGNMVVRTRQVRETEWWPLDGRHHRYYAGFLVSGSRGLPQADAERIKPFNLPALKRYRPYFLAGWMAEEVSIARDNALTICQREFQRDEEANVATFLPGDTHRDLAVSTEFSDVNSDLCLLPVYILSYRYRDKLFRFLVNGQTGKFDGDKPVSWQRILAAALGGVCLVLLVVVIVVLIAHA